MRRPGARILPLARRLTDRRTMDRLIAPAVADLQHEYREAARQPGAWPRRRALARGYLSLLRLAIPVGFGCARRFSTGFLVEDDHVAGRLLAFMLAAVAVVTATLVLPPLLEFQQRWPLDTLLFRLLPLLDPRRSGSHCRSDCWPVRCWPCAGGPAFAAPSRSPVLRSSRSQWGSSRS